MMFPLVSDLAAEGIPVTTTCGVLGFSTQAFYKWRAEPVSDRDWADAHTINAIIDAHADDPEFGYRFIADELEAVGERSCERRVWRLCSQQRIWSTTTKQGRKSHGKTPGPAVHDDLVQRVFSAPAPDVLWLTDITEHPTLEGKLYCCSIKDVFSNRIVGYAFGPRMTAQLAVRALRSAIARRRPEGTVVVHSDRGGQFRSRAFRAALKANGLIGSMGRVAAAADNAAMESFYALLQKNVLNRRRRWRTRDELTSELITWIEHTYNHRRRQRGLGRLSPVAYELAFVSPPCLEDTDLAA